MLNKFMAIGRLTRDSELKYTKNSKAIANFSIAINKFKKDDVLFMDVNLWGKSAEAVNQYLLKGTQVYVEGEIEIQKWEKEGVKHQKTVVNCFNVQLLGSKSDSGMDRQDQKFQEQVSAEIPF
jgi:single-strand DNA-binding protein